MNKLKPGDKVLVEAEIVEFTDDGYLVETGHGWDFEFVSDESKDVHPLPPAVWVARSNHAHHRVHDSVCIYHGCKPVLLATGYFDGVDYDSIRLGTFIALYGEQYLPAPGTCRRMHLLAIPAREEEPES